MKRLVIALLPVLDPILLILLWPAAWLLKLVRRIGVHRLPICKRALMKIGVFPIRDHYYEPQFKDWESANPTRKSRTLGAIDWNDLEQLQWLARFKYASEITDLPREKRPHPEYYLENGSFHSGDAECWYQMVRAIKPARIFEVGCGYSTILAARALKKNRELDPKYSCKHVCIEPYEVPWLDSIGVSVLRKRIEEIDLSFFSELEANDILFIDSSHMIRPGGDVEFEYLHLLPSLKKGVIVHIHDIFSPNDYPKEWIREKVLFWNEQYLVEAFLSNNSAWKIIVAVNYLHHTCYDRLKALCPHLDPSREPASLYLQKIA